MLAKQIFRIFENENDLQSIVFESENGKLVSF
jgi:hypothetical protein